MPSRGRRVREREYSTGSFTPDGRRVVVYPGVLTGPPGEQGIRGPRGPRGPVGPKGDLGASGAAGVDGQDTYWTLITDTTTDLVTQLAGIAASEQVWLAPGTYTLGGVLTMPAGSRLAGTREAVVWITSNADYIDLANDGSSVTGFHLRVATFNAAGSQAIEVGADYCCVSRMLIDTTNPVTNRFDYGIQLTTASHCEIFDNAIRMMFTDSGIYLTTGGTEVGNIVRDNFIDLGDIDEGGNKYGICIVKHTVSIVQGNYIDLGDADDHVGIRPDDQCIVSQNTVIQSGSDNTCWGILCNTAANLVVLSGNTFMNVLYGIDVTASADDWVVTGNQIYADPDAALPYGILVRTDRKREWVIANNLIDLYESGVGIYLNASAASFSRITITGNLVSGRETSNGIYAERGGAFTADYLVLAGNMIRTGGACITLDEGVRYASVSSNVCRIIGITSNCVVATNAGASSWHAIVGNVCHGAGVNSGIYLNADDCTVDNNNCQGFAADSGGNFPDGAATNVGIGNMGGGTHRGADGNIVIHNVPPWDVR